MKKILTIIVILLFFTTAMAAPVHKFESESGNTIFLDEAKIEYTDFCADFPLEIVLSVPMRTKIRLAYKLGNAPYTGTFWVFMRPDGLWQYTHITLVDHEGFITYDEDEDIPEIRVVTQKDYGIPRSLHDIVFGDNWGHEEIPEDDDLSWMDNLF